LAHACFSGDEGRVGGGTFSYPAFGKDDSGEARLAETRPFEEALDGVFVEQLVEERDLADLEKERRLIASRG